MSTIVPIADKILTAEEFASLPDDGRLLELERGRMVAMNRPETLDGKYLGKISTAFALYLLQHDVGHLVINDSGIITERDPDTVRGADVAFYSYQLVPKDSMQRGYWPAPEIVMEVRSQSDRWKRVVSKAGEYLDAGVLVVGVLDPFSRKLHVYAADRPTLTLGDSERLDLGEMLPDIVPGFIIQVRDFL